MSEPRFDILFDGALLPEADPMQVRTRLGAAFKLDAAGVERLFCGKAVIVKRDADAATAERYRQVFAEAGAVVRLRALGGEASPQPPAADTAEAARMQPGQANPSATPPRPEVPDFSTSADFDQLEEPPPVKAPALDLSHLSLVSGTDWDLSDCTPPPPTTPVPDTSHLRLADSEPSPPEDDPTSDTLKP
ncbi:hypothetical protein GWK36_04195 [Caldichromatium japonicum]|uniref:Uncharacterized protein n=1 Tax=Caldichromatium japonicum TaxID=2699430 RepID=A0A6G7VBH4_9GAMM|nr:hypothetical protein [Caldichromatium japonicum]QIK37324.1 hypothetical protein GWK36_04195 [Caldichromatium japonicum]